MDTHGIPQPDPSSFDELVAPATQKRIDWIDGHMPEIVQPLDPQHPDTDLTKTRRLRHDGWTPEKMRTFLSAFAECGVIKEACLAVGMSGRSLYNLCNRDPLFAAGLDAARAMARPRLADEAYSRSMNGVVERIYKDGAIVAERHRYDNKLTMAVLGRLDRRADRDEARGAPHLGLVANWDDYLDALGEDRRDDGLALLAPPAPTSTPAPPRGQQEKAGERELRELRPGADGQSDWKTEDEHKVWEDEEGWWTDYPPPADFDGEEEGRYGALDYRRSLAPAEQAVIDAEIAAEDAEEAEWLAADLARAEAQRDAYFRTEPPGDSEPGGTPREQSANVGRPAALPTGSTGSEPVLSLSKGRPDPAARRLTRHLLRQSMAGSPHRPEIMQALALLARLSEAMRARGLPRPILVGGAAVEYYSGSAMMTGDVDLASPVQPELEQELLKLGFTKPEGLGHTPLGWVHPELKLGFEVVTATPMGGTVDHNRIALIDLDRDGAFAILPVEDLIADRMGQYASGTAPELLEQAQALFDLHPELDRDYLERRIRDETLGDHGIEDLQG